MAVSEDFVNYIKEQLSDFSEVEMKKMFGGIGLFHQGKMFGMIANATFRLKVNDSNQADFEAKGKKPYHSEKKGKGMPYWEVPADILEDKALLAKWASKSIQTTT